MRSVLVLNPGSTSTKLSVFSLSKDEQDPVETAARTLRHSTADLQTYPRVTDQIELRHSAIASFLDANSLEPKAFDAVIGRGGLLKPLGSGVYKVDEAMVADLSAATYGEHASNLGGILARTLAEQALCPAFIADPVVVDELDDVARLSGHPELPRRSIFHALNQKSSAREAAGRHGWVYEQINLIVAHMGGGCSVGAHRRGRVVDVNNALDGEGPFSPERAGTLPAGQLVALALSGDHDHDQLKRMLTGHGGMVAYAGTNDLTELLDQARQGDAQADLVFRSMVFQVAKEIAQHSATLQGDVQLIVLTGGMAHNEYLVRALTSRVGHIAPVEVVPGEREMISLARAAFSALAGDCEVRVYSAEA